MTDIFSLEGRTAVVTGCAGGIGRGLALGLARAGADLIALDIGDLAETAAAVQALGRTCACYQVDLSEAAAVDEVWTRLLEQAGTVDILFNNAGMQYRQTVLDFPAEKLDQILAVNLRAGYLLAQRAGRHFIRRAQENPDFHGKIINTASLFSAFGGVEVSGYTCSKHAVVGMTRALSNELAPYGICVNAIAPGYIETELTRTIWSDPVRRRPMDERIPAGRWGMPEDFAGAAVFLASAASDYITGAVLPVDGGYSVR